MWLQGLGLGIGVQGSAPSFSGSESLHAEEQPIVSTRRVVPCNDLNGEILRIPSL